MYQQHPSRELNSLFRHRPFQGADPVDARFLFVGLDATMMTSNYGKFQAQLDREAQAIARLINRDG